MDPYINNMSTSELIRFSETIIDYSPAGVFKDTFKALLAHLIELSDLVEDFELNEGIAVITNDTKQFIREVIS